jgi:CheY-like chemotaxis protein
MSDKGSTLARARHILVVDDDHDFTQLFKEFLVSAGNWIVHTADHYAPALVVLREHPVTLAVLDLNMPVMDGMQLLRLLKQTYPALNVIVLTSAASQENRDFCLQNGAALFFDKAEVATGFDRIYAAMEAVAAAPSEGFRGVLRQVGLAEVLQLECLGRKSLVLEVTTAGSSGRIYVHDGSIVHAEIEEKTGEPALVRLLGLKGGEFKIHPYTPPARQTIDGYWESLMMEAARIHDEASAGGLLDEAGNLITASPPPVTPPQPAREIEEIVLCSLTGELLYEWQAASVEERIQALDRFFNLSHSIGQVLGWDRGERLEVESAEERLILMFEPDRKLLIRSRLPSLPPT